MTATPASPATPVTTPDPSSSSGPGSRRPPTPAARRVVRFQAGAALAAAFGAYAKRFLPLTALAVFAAAPGLCLTATYPWEAAKNLDDLRDRGARLSLWSMAIGWLPGLIALGAASGIVVRDLRGEAWSFASEALRATKKLWWLVGLEAVWLTMLVPVVTSIVGIYFLWLLVGPIPGLASACIVGSLAVFIYLGFQVSAQALLLEDLSPIGAMRRSLSLTKGRRFAVYVALSSVFLPILLGFCGVLIWFLVEAPIEFRFAQSVDAARRNSMLITACHAPLHMLSCVLHAVIYHDLRCEKEALAAAGQSG